jgi:hypothetical protein
MSHEMTVEVNIYAIQYILIHCMEVHLVSNDIFQYLKPLV